MRELIIVGAGGHGLEMVWLAKRCGRKIKGFLDDTPEKQHTQIMGLDVLGKVNAAIDYYDCDFIVAVGNPHSRKKIIDQYLADEKIRFTTLIDPSAIIGENIIIGDGSMICAGSILTVNVKLGQHCIININSTLSHGVDLGNFVTLAPNCSLSGDVVIHNQVEIGANAVVREKLIINESVIVGMGAVVTKNIEKNSIMVGNPAKQLKL